MTKTNHSHNATRTLLPGDRVMTDWALGSSDGKRHLGVLLKICGAGRYAVVDWNDAGVGEIVRLESLTYVSDLYHCPAAVRVAR